MLGAGAGSLSFSCIFGPVHNLQTPTLYSAQDSSRQLHSLQRELEQEQVLAAEDDRKAALQRQWEREAQDGAQQQLVHEKQLLRSLREKLEADQARVAEQERHVKAQARECTGLVAQAAEARRSVEAQKAAKDAENCTLWRDVKVARHDLAVAERQQEALSQIVGSLRLQLQTAQADHAQAVLFPSSPAPCLCTFPA